jgi:peptidoglycan-associated lipoprotein
LNNLQPQKIMKLNQIGLAFVLPLAVMLAVTGCKHNYKGKTTMLPDHGGGQTSTPTSTPTDQTQPNFDTKPINQQDNTATSTSTPYKGGPIDTSATWDPANMNVDKTKLAAYTVHFKYDSAVVEDSEQADITSVAQALAGDPNAKLLIEGHCDERGTEEYNRALGERRALALREALAKQGVDAGRVRTISYGKDQPVDPGHDEAAWKQNRRGQFDWCTPKTPVP